MRVSRAIDVRLGVACVILLIFIGACRAIDCKNDTVQVEEISSNIRAAVGLDVSDVSILFPHPKKAERLDLLLGADDRLANGQEIWPVKGFDSLIMAVAVPPTGLIPAATQPGSSTVQLPGPGIGVPGEGLRDRSRWRVVGFRFDPCAQAEEGGVCLVQIRLVVQPFVESGGEVKDEDVTAHLIFSFRAGVVKDLITALQHLKRAETTGKPLGVHPAMVREGLEGETAASARTFLVNELAKGRLTHAALMGLVSNPEPWVFVAGAFLPDGSFIPIELDFGEDRAVSQRVASRGIRENRVVPRLANSLSTAALVDGDRRSMSDEDARVLARVDSPVHSALLPGSQRSPRNRDCVSCHTTTSSLFKLSGQGKSLSDLSKWIGHSDRFRAAEGVTGYPDPAALVPSFWSVRNFGYFRGDPAISIRTVNESAEAARIANERVGAANPSKLRCDDEKLWGCILGGAGREDSGAACFASHCSEVR